MHLLDDLTTRECRDFAQAWQDWRGTELIPRRFEVRIEEIVELLPLMTVMEVISPEAATFRLAGTALSEGLGFELTGHNYFDMAPPDTRALRVARTWQVATQPCGSLFLCSIIYQSGRAVPSEVLTLPIWPNEPSVRPHLFAVSMALEETRMEGPASEANQLPIGEGYQFIDIGAGLPDASLDLADLPPATLLAQAG
ncbi:MAG: PAS domain-containing protein [Alphaproteobacteria bacterium]|jgi:hypothetical protein|nr:PAS domain-containing protein [Alphaproteobacteria bacterium]